MPRVIKVAPACAVMISTYEFGKAFFQKMNLDREWPAVAGVCPCMQTSLSGPTGQSLLKRGPRHIQTWDKPTFLNLNKSKYPDALRTVCFIICFFGTDHTSMNIFWSESQFKYRTRPRWTHWSSPLCRTVVKRIKLDRRSSNRLQDCICITTVAWVGEINVLILHRLHGVYSFIQRGIPRIQTQKQQSMKSEKC